MVLAAGLGRRLRPLTDCAAKSLAPVGDRPALAHVLDWLRRAGADRIVVNAHHRADDVRRFVGALRETVALSEESELLGTAGGVAHAASLLGTGDVVVWNADVLVDVDLEGLSNAHASGGSEATLLVRPLPPGSGPVGIDRNGRVVRLRHERFGREDRGGEFLGVSILAGSLRARLPSRGCLVADAWLPMLRAGRTLRAFLYSAAWHDIGTVESYMMANRAWLDARGVAHWAHPTAKVAMNVTLERTILGQGSSVAGHGSLLRCVVWPDAQAIAPLADAVVTPTLMHRLGSARP